MASPAQASALEAALRALNDPTDAAQLPSLARAVTREADDLELVAEETSSPLTRARILHVIAQARKVVTVARANARRAALANSRAQLLDDAHHTAQPPAVASLARDIHDSLRRSTAVVSDEIARSRAAGNVIEQSTRRLRHTTDQHATYRHTLASGAATLKTIRTSEAFANLLVVLSFALFFFAAAYVAKRRISNSNLATFVVTPGLRAASLPVRILSAAGRALGVRSKPDIPIKLKVVDDIPPSPANQADGAMKAKEGRQFAHSHPHSQLSANAHQMEHTPSIAKIEQDSKTHLCDSSSDADDSDSVCGVN